MPLLWGDANISHFLITEEDQATPLLKELLSLEGIQEKNLTDIVAITQAKWIAARQGARGTERRDLFETGVDESKKKKILGIARRIGLFSPVKPTRKHYDYAVCLGAFLGTAKKRLEGLIALWEQGVRFDTLVFLGGERYLRETSGDSLDIFGKLVIPIGSLYRTEFDMLKLLWKIKQKEMPQSMREALEGKVIFVNAPRGKAARPSTADTFRNWLEEHRPKPGSVLSMSTIGFVSYQHLVGKNCLGKVFYLDTVCPEGEQVENPTVVVTLDTLAKVLYEIEKERK